jgi:hypothetical protein
LQKHLLHICLTSLAGLLAGLLIVLPGQLPLAALAQTQTQPQTLAQTQAGSASVGGRSLRQQLEENTTKILRVLIAMERYNLNYRLSVAKHGRWKGWRYFVSQEANAGLCVAGFTVSTAERCGHFQRPRRLARIYLENGNWLTFTGQILGASGSATEFGINCWHEMEARKHGYAPAAARKQVLRTVHEIDALLAERHQLIDRGSAASASPGYVKLARAEESVLLDIRDLSLSEFRVFQSSARGFIAFQQTLYILDIARNVTGAMGSHCGWAGLQTGDRHYNETAGILGDLSGIITMLNPLVSRAVGRAVGKYESGRDKACFDGAKEGDVERLEQDLSALKLATSPELQGEDLPVLRTALYSAADDGVRKQLTVNTIEQRASYQVAAENIESGAIIGLTKLAPGILFNVAGDRYVLKPRRSNVLLGSASIIGLVGNVYAVCENLRIQVKHEIKHDRLTRDQQHPEQVLRARLAKLDEVEKQL